MAFKKGVQKDGSWYIYAGDRNRVPWILMADDRAWNLLGCVVKSMARKRDTDTAYALVADVEMVDPVHGEVAISWDGEAVRALLAGRSTWQGLFDIQVTSAGQTLPETIHREKMVAQMDITREQ